MRRNPVEYRNEPTKPGKYVYLFSLDGTPAYVGKGGKDRLWDHERAALHHTRKTRWQRVLAGAIRRVVPVSVEVLAEGMSNEEANAYEVQLIAQYGRLDLKTGTLHNRTAGGDGLTSEDAIRVFSNPKTKKKLIRARRRTARDQLYRAKMALGHRRGWADPKIRARRVAINRATLSRPGVRAKQVATCAITNQRPDVKARRSEAAKALHRDPEYRQRLYTALRRAANRPERKEQVRQQMIERNKDPVFSRNRLEGIQRYWREERTSARPVSDKGRASSRKTRS